MTKTTDPMPPTTQVLTDEEKDTIRIRTALAVGELLAFLETHGGHDVSGSSVTLRACGPFGLHTRVPLELTLTLTADQRLGDWPSQSQGVTDDDY